MPIFFISSEQVHDRQVTITGALHRHLWGSLRCRAGDELRVVDEAQRGYRVRLVEADAVRLRGEILEELRAMPRSAPRLVLAQALLKGERMDWVIQKATELGVAEIRPLITAHAVVRPRAERLESQRERWRRIALEAAQQSERWDLPQVAAPVEAKAFFREAADWTLKLLLQERSRGESLARLPLPETADATLALAIGPEGGWLEEETAAAAGFGFLPVTLGPRILRAETATLAALAVLQSRLGGLG